MLRNLISLILLANLFACSTGQRRPPIVTPPPPVVPPPQFIKTFGSMRLQHTASMVLRYKTFTLLIDPHLSADEASALLPETDYLILTDAQPHHFSPTVESNARKNIKIIVPAQEAATVKSAGFSEVKSLGNGQRLMLKKDDSFIFVSAVTNNNSLSKHQTNSYLLEFDNGRNIFISGEVSNPDGLREFLYAIRDDGKELYAGIFYRQPGVPEETLAQTIGLMQPQNSLLVQTNSPGSTKFNETTLRTALTNEMYDKPLVILQIGKEIPF